MRVVAWTLGLAAIVGVVIWSLAETASVAPPTSVDSEDNEASGPHDGASTQPHADAASPSREPAHVVEVEPAHTAAASSAQPHLTLEGALESTFQKLDWGKGRFAGSSNPFKDVANVLDDPQLNPDRKELTPEQFEALRSLVDEWFDRLADASDKSWEIRKDAMMRASRRGQFAIARSPFDPDDPNKFLPSEARKRMQVAKAMVLELHNTTRERLGVAPSEWRHSLVSTGEPDGHPKQVLVYFLTRDEPQFVAAEEAYLKLEKARTEAMRAFLKQLP